MSTFSRSRIPSITHDSWERLAPLFRRGSSINEDELREAGALAVDAATAVMLGLYQSSLAKLMILVHHCGKTVAAREFKQGFQPTPWTCPSCSHRVQFQDELRYSFEIFVTEDVELVP